MKRLYVYKYPKRGHVQGEQWNISTDPNRPSTLEEMVDYLSMSENSYISLLQNNGAITSPCLGGPYEAFHWFDNKENCLQAMKQAEKFLRDTPFEMKTSKINVKLYAACSVPMFTSQSSHQWSISFDKKEHSEWDSLTYYLKIDEKAFLKVLQLAGSNRYGHFINKEACQKAIEHLQSFLRKIHDEPKLHVIKWGEYKEEYFISTQRYSLEKMEETVAHLHMDLETYRSFVHKQNGTVVNERDLFQTANDAQICIANLEKELNCILTVERELQLLKESLL